MKKEKGSLGQNEPLVQIPYIRGLLDQHILEAAQELRQYEMEAGNYDNADLDKRLLSLVDNATKEKGKRWRAGRVVAACVALCIGVVAWGYLAEAVRLPIISRFRPSYQDHAMVNTIYDLAALKENGVNYGPHWLPDGYAIDGISEARNYTLLTFSNNAEQTMGSLYIYKANMSVSDDTDHGGEVVSVGGEDGFLTTHDGTTVLTWRLGYQYFRLKVPDNVDAVRIAENVQRIE